MPISNLKLSELNCPSVAWLTLIGKEPPMLIENENISTSFGPWTPETVHRETGINFSDFATSVSIAVIVAPVSIKAFVSIFLAYPSRLSRSLTKIVTGTIIFLA